MPTRSGDLQSLRELNRLRVIDALQDEGTASRAEIARRTGLSRTTVSTIVADLQRRPAESVQVEQAAQVRLWLREEPGAPC